MIIDAFIFNNELDVLDIRLHEVQADRYVLVECDHTFTNIPKPLHYQENKHLFKEFEDKIVHIVHKSKLHSNPWDNEHDQRNAVREGMPGHPDDLIIVTDVDEIPKNEIIKDYGEPKCIHMDQMNHYLNLLSTTPVLAKCTRLTKYKDMPQNISEWRFREVLSSYRLPSIYGGWHFSWLGDALYLVDKVKSYSHSEVNKYPFNDVEAVKKVIVGGCTFDFWGNSVTPLVKYPIEKLPQYVQDNLEKYERYIFT